MSEQQRISERWFYEVGFTSPHEPDLIELVEALPDAAFVWGWGTRDADYEGGPVELEKAEARLEAAERRVEDIRALLAECWEWIEGEWTGPKGLIGEAANDLGARVAAALSTTEEPKEEPCSECGGRGWRSSAIPGTLQAVECPTCKGTGKRAEEPARAPEGA